MKDEYTQIDLPGGMTMLPCPCCGAETQLWQYISNEGAAYKVVMCSNGGRFGPQDAFAESGCPLFMPARTHYKATKREAVKYWNEFAKALEAQRRKRNWESARARGGVLRAATQGSAQ